MEKEFEVIVIGTGPAGSAIAESSGEKGLNTAIIDSRGYGGTCPLRGCNPKKVLASATNLIAKNKRMQGKGLRENSTIDWKDLIDRKSTRLNSSHVAISYAVFCLKKKTDTNKR